MSERGKELMAEFRKKYPETEGAAINWWSNLSDEDKQEVITTFRDMVIAIGEAWEAISKAVMQAAEAITKAWAEFSDAWMKEVNHE